VAFICFNNFMPFKRIKKKGKRMYRSPSGRKYTARQVRAYYATGGWKRKPKRKRK
jgi:hypothetical protein